ncbi:DEAD/DEAH box helicase [Burkholderia cepacia]|uniref:DEAD/DEAH box helicase n=1 Tax=Burkholderia cepacia TaxID=292 RepID=UPI001F3C58D7|nr:DEAD/DEAH box helicase [Burkholderia cepacia]UIY55599.1 DEAD/DEAH box helicase [Burkholderia cepacia]
MPLSFERLRNEIESAKSAAGVNWFSLLRGVSTYLNATRGGAEEARGQELVIRLLDIRHLLGEYDSILDAFVREAGLFPYLNPENLGLPDSLAYEAHKPDVGADTVFHRVQAQVFHLLMSGQSVVLSAPTSFGKSLIVDAVVASGRYKNIVIVVPTLALLDETRRRLARISQKYRIITHSSQEPGDRNIFVHTQERVVENKNIQEADFFVIDEFYKLNPSDESERAQTLNLAFYKLSKQAKQFYMLGPNIQGIPPAFAERFQCVFIKTDFNTVVSEIHKIDVDDDLQHAIQLCCTLDEPTLIYVQSPNRARTVAARLKGVLPQSIAPAAKAAAAWVRDNFHSQWLFAAALDAGIGVHHGRLPRSLTQLVVRNFNKGALKYLVCTSTLIEGVNTRAKNVIILDNKVATKKFDYFTFSNIRGRSGRMREHFIGHVYLYHEPPQAELPFIDIPIVTQSEDASDALLIQVDPDELNQASTKKVAKYFDDPLLPLEILKENAGIDPGAQLNLGNEILHSLPVAHAMLSWRGYPSIDQWRWTCELVWKHFTNGRFKNGVASGAQLAFLLSKTLQAKRFEDAVALFKKDGMDIDEAIELTLDFQRQWAEFRAPNLLSALNRIQRYIFGRYNLQAGNYDAYISHIENLGRSPVVNALDEYGLPTQIGQIVWERLGSPETLDETLVRLRDSKGLFPGLTLFENLLVTEVRATL